MSAGTAIVATLVAPRRVEMREEPLPEIGRDDLLCETIVTAMSPGTELAAFVGAPPLREGIGYPRLLGYCNVARVTAVGDNVRNLRVGNRVLTFSSHRSAFVAAEKDVLFRLPDTADADDVACSYLFHLGYNATLRSNVRAGSRVCVIGLGVLGLTTVAAAALAGAVVSGISDQQRPSEIAIEFGASSAVARPVVADKLARGEIPLADVVVVTTNTWDDWQIALRVAAQRGTIAVLGFPGRSQGSPELNPLDSRFFYAKQLRIEAVGLSPENPDSRGFNRFNEKDNIAHIVELMRRGRLMPKRLVSERFSGEQILRAYEQLLARTGSPITYLLDWP